MNDNVINQSGVQPLLPFINEIKNLLDKPSESRNYAKIISTLQMHGIKSFFSFHSSPDMKNSNHCIGTIYQSGLGMILL